MIFSVLTQQVSAGSEDVVPKNPDEVREATSPHCAAMRKGNRADGGAKAEILKQTAKNIPVQLTQPKDCCHFGCLGCTDGCSAQLFLNVFAMIAVVESYTSNLSSILTTFPLHHSDPLDRPPKAFA